MKTDKCEKENKVRESKRSKRRANEKTENLLKDSNIALFVQPPKSKQHSTHHSGLIVVLARWQRCHARSLSSRVVERRRNGAVCQSLREIEIVILLRRQLAGFLVGVQRSQTVSRSTRARPVFGNRQNLASLQQPLLKQFHPVGTLEIVRCTNDRHVETVLLVVDGGNRFLEGGVCVRGCHDADL